MALKTFLSRLLIAALFVAPLAALHAQPPVQSRDQGKAAHFDSLAGQLLVASPNIGDPRFERAVILMCAHSPEHAMGIAVNRPLEGVSLAELLDRLGLEAPIQLKDRAVLSGGPVERERGFVLHSEDFAAPQSTLSVTDGVALTATREVLEAISDPAHSPRQAVLALGCAGWSPGQLEREIRERGISERQSALDDIAQLAHVAGPVVALQLIDQRGRLRE